MSLSVLIFAVYYQVKRNVSRKGGGMGNVTTRLFTLIQLLQLRPLWTATELSDELDVSVRTVHRYLGMLEEMGIPIVSERGRGGGFALLRGYNLPPMIFTAEEATALALGANLVEEVFGALYQDALISATAKLDNVLPDDLRQEVAGALRTLVFSRLTARDYRPWQPALRTLRAAIADRRRVHLTYQAFSQEETCRDVDPYALAFRSGFWYLVGYCHLRDDMRMFRVDRIQALQARAERFTLPRDFDAHAYLETSTEYAQSYHVVVWLDARVAPIVREYSGAWMDLTEHDDGAVTAHFDANDLNWATGWVLSYGSMARALEPPELVTRVRAEAQRVVDCYSES